LGNIYRGKRNPRITEKIDLIIIADESIQPPFGFLDFFCNGMLYNEEKKYHFMNCINPSYYERIRNETEQKKTIVTGRVDQRRLTKLLQKGWVITNICYDYILPFGPEQVKNDVKCIHCNNCSCKVDDAKKKFIFCYCDDSRAKKFVSMVCCKSIICVKHLQFSHDCPFCKKKFDYASMEAEIRCVEYFEIWRRGTI
jgi:hypothetical protein